MLHYKIQGFLMDGILNSDVVSKLFLFERNENKAFR